MTLRECVVLIQEDKNRFNIDATGKKVSVLQTSLFRIGCYLNDKDNYFAKFSLILVKVQYFLLQLLTGIQLPIGTRVLGGGKISSLFMYHYLSNEQNRKKLHYSSGSDNRENAFW